MNTEAASNKTRSTATRRRTPPLSSVSERGFSVLELLVVITVGVIAAAIAVPRINQMVMSSRISGNARSLAEEITVAKMRAAAHFTQARIHADLAARTYQLEECTRIATNTSNNCTGAGDSWLKANGQPVQGPFPLPQGVTFGTGGVATAPPNTGVALAQAGQCLDNTGAAIANSACIIFNSRGLSITDVANPAAQPQIAPNALYITNGQQVYSVTVSATGLIQTWFAAANSAAFTAL